MGNNKSIEEIENYYNNFLSYLVKDRIYPNKRHIHIKGIVKKFINKGDIVLDLGCGIGITTEFIKNRGADVVGIDISPEIIKYACKTVPNVEFICEDILNINLKKKFDVICIFDCLEHVTKDKYEKLFAILKEHSKPKAKILITIPNPLAIEKIRNTNPKELQIVDESIFFTDLIPIIQKNGFIIRRLELYGIDYKDEYYFINLEYLPVAFEIQPLHKSNVFLKLLFPFRYISYIYRKMKYSSLIYIVLFFLICCHCF
jgi:2-polyprenyl-3-methyl-5-hydroxy-6-metoxy-1,4-benzoquinol methylase